MDHFKNISGYAPGKLASLNINGEFFIGGHENFNFTGRYLDLVLNIVFIIEMEAILTTSKQFQKSFDL